MGAIRTAAAALAVGLLFAYLPSPRTADEARAQTAGTVIAGDLEISDYWTWATQPGEFEASGFLTISNNGGRSERLLGASTPLSMWTEIYSLIQVDGRRILHSLRDGLEIPPGSTVALRPGSHHLQFVDIEFPFAAGQTVEVLLTFQRAGKVRLVFPVRQRVRNRPGTNR